MGPGDEKLIEEFYASRTELLKLNINSEVLSQSSPNQIALSPKTSALALNAREIKLKRGKLEKIVNTMADYTYTEINRLETLFLVKEKEMQALINNQVPIVPTLHFSVEQLVAELLYSLEAEMSQLKVQIDKLYRDLVVLEDAI